MVAAASDGVRITEDEVKEAVRSHLSTWGFDVAVAWGRVRGIDIDARHPDARRYIIEAKAEVGTNGPQQVNYFLSMLGELVQRMDDADASYGIALPANRRTVALSTAFPHWPSKGSGSQCFWVSRDDDTLNVQVDW